MQLYRFEPDAVAVDMHPRYISSQWGRELGPPVTEVQHHHAHIVSCMAEHSLDGPALGVAWDGVGYGTGGEAWGSEFMMTTRDGFSQLGHINGFPLPGGEAAVHKPWKSALGLLWETFGDEVRDVLKQTPLSKFLNVKDVELNLRMMKHGVNSPRVRGVGRVFDSVASMLGVRHVCSFEGQAAMELEGQAWMAFETVRRPRPYDFQISGNGVKKVSLGGLVDGVLQDISDGLETGEISLKFHMTLAEIVREFVSDQAGSGIPVVLSGGVFQNSLLTTLVKKALTEEKVQVYTHRIVPPNDGGISLGQAVIADAEAR
jgi:hydrogenase maturation protein HypF